VEWQKIKQVFLAALRKCLIVALVVFIFLVSGWVAQPAPIGFSSLPSLSWESLVRYIVYYRLWFTVLSLLLLLWAAMDVKTA